MKTLYGSDVKISDIMDTMKHLIDCANNRLSWYKVTKDSSHYNDFCEYIDCALVYKKNLDMIIKEDCNI